MHVHVRSANGEAKFWIEPTVSLVDFACYNQKELLKLQKIIEDRKDEIKTKWKTHFSS
ncbi:MAG: DUF4160 domain-containing protein [Bacteroidota bacterium]